IVATSRRLSFPACNETDASLTFPSFVERNGCFYGQGPLMRLNSREKRPNSRALAKVASNLLPPRVGSPKAADPSPGLRPPLPRGEGQGVRGRQVNKLDQSLNFVATKEP